MQPLLPLEVHLRQSTWIQLFISDVTMQTICNKAHRTMLRCTMHCQEHNIPFSSSQERLSRSISATVTNY